MIGVGQERPSMWGNSSSSSSSSELQITKILDIQLIIYRFISTVRTYSKRTHYIYERACRSDQKRFHLSSKAEFIINQAS